MAFTFLSPPVAHFSEELDLGVVAWSPRPALRPPPGPAPAGTDPLSVRQFTKIMNGLAQYSADRLAATPQHLWWRPVASGERGAARVLH